SRSTSSPLPFPLPRHQISRLFPYTTLFRSARAVPANAAAARARRVISGRKPRGEVLRTPGITAHPRGSEYLTPGLPYYFLSISLDRKSTRLNSSHEWISYAVFCLKKKKYIKDLEINCNGVEVFAQEQIF